MSGARGTPFHGLAWAALVLTFLVVILGAYVRLSDAGLGCPDWPGCYGRPDVPDEAHQIAEANAAYPHRPVEPAKAWKEMVHRYFAGALGLSVLALAVLAWRRRGEPGQPLSLPLALLGLIVFQALLGMWTVTWQLKPVVVMAHLLGGLTTLGLLAWLVLRQGRYGADSTAADDGAVLRGYALLGLVLLVGQIALGGWTSANYAALACPDFPTCQAHWWPPMDFREAFTLWRGLGISYEGGVLANDARVTIHMMHRLGALTVFLYLGWLSWRLLATSRSRGARFAGWTMAVLLVGQLALGIANVVLRLPLPVAVAHNAGAALLLLALVALNHLLRPEPFA
ncbi:MAG: COX15/CtaA family protein [Candidatus Competibacter sp.]|nr:COX15/CtaA family protein [Candidatus Competibacter sp.]